MAVRLDLFSSRITLPNVFNYLRCCPPESLEEFYDEFMKTSDSLSSQRKLFQFLHSHHNRCLPGDVIIAIVATLCDKSLPLVLRKICLYILQESLPNNEIRLQDLEQSGAMTNMSPSLLELFTTIHMGEEGREELHLFGNKLIRCITSSDNSYVSIKLRALQVLVQLAQYLRSPLPHSEVEFLAHSLKSFLGSKTVAQLPKSIKRKESWAGMTDKDDVVQFSTALHFVDNPYSDDDLDIHTFSALHQLWSSIFGRYHQFRPVEQELSKKMVEYSQHILEQVERTPLKSLDSSLQQAALIESLLLLNDACWSDPTQVARVIPIVRRVHDRASIPEVILPALRFLLMQGQHVGYNPSSELENFFKSTLVKASKNLCSSCEVVLFLRDHLEEFNSMPSVPLQRWFPNILKILAWFPVTFISEFMDLLPAFMSDSTAIEVLHCVLDLPCLSAALLCMSDEELQNRSNILSSLQNANCKSMLTFILRQKSGGGETLERLHLLHAALRDVIDHSRVRAAADVVPSLLKAYFEVINDNADANVASRLLPVMLDRSTTLYFTPGYSAGIQRTFSEEMIRIIQKHPRLISEAKQEIGDFLCSNKDPSESLCTNLVWAIGQYASSAFCGDVTFELIHSYYDVLECMTYEHLSNSRPETISIVAATLVKLASRYQDLVPRVLLCLSKIDQFAKMTGTTEWNVVSARIQEFVALLSEPNVAFAVLSPSVEALSGRYHGDCATLPVLWRAASVLLHSPSLVAKVEDQKPRVNSYHEQAEYRTSVVVVQSHCEAP